MYNGESLCIRSLFEGGISSKGAAMLPHVDHPAGCDEDVKVIAMMGAPMLSELEKWRMDEVEDNGPPLHDDKDDEDKRMVMLFLLVMLFLRLMLVSTEDLRVLKIFYKCSDNNDEMYEDLLKYQFPATQKVMVNIPSLKFIGEGPKMTEMNKMNSSKDDICSNRIPHGVECGDIRHNQAILHSNFYMSHVGVHGHADGEGDAEGDVEGDAEGDVEGDVEHPEWLRDEGDEPHHHAVDQEEDVAPETELKGVFRPAAEYDMEMMDMIYEMEEDNFKKLKYEPLYF